MPFILDEKGKLSISVIATAILALGTADIVENISAQMHCLYHLGSAKLSRFNSEAIAGSKVSTFSGQGSWQ